MMKKRQKDNCTYTSHRIDVRDSKFEDKKDMQTVKPAWEEHQISATHVPL